MCLTVTIKGKVSETTSLEIKMVCNNMWDIWKITPDFIIDLHSNENYAKIVRVCYY
jgi:hypothetical protein